MIEKKKKKKKKKSDFMLYLYLMMKSCKELNVMIVLATIYKYMIGERSPDEEEEEEDDPGNRRADRRGAYSVAGTIFCLGGGGFNPKKKTPKKPKVEIAGSFLKPFLKGKILRSGE